ncbi:MAG TPA: SRPBCC family protein [Anaerolineaceae bacterium]|nr:SRPBCC family protein [Anaerolineaceae bacterium]
MMPKFERKVEIDAPVEKVWEVLTDPTHWQEWFPGIDSVTNVTSINAGGTFELTNENRPGQGSIVAVQSLKRLEIITQIGDDKDSHVFELRPSGGFLGLSADECEVEYTLDTLVGGGILGNFITGGNPRDMIRVKKAMHALRKLVESL